MMKKLLVIFSTCILSYNCDAQTLPSRDRAAAPASRIALSNTQQRYPLRNAKGTLATAFVTDTFSASSLTTGGWVAGGNTPAAGTWKFTKQASTNVYSIGNLNSTSRAGGWMIYDSDSIGVLFNSSPQIGTLTSPSYSCTGHNYVGVRFEQYTRRFLDTFIIQVSNNGGTSWTSYPIAANMALYGDEKTPNPLVTTVNITATAANQANVKVRFYYSCSVAGGAWNWLVDDFQLVDLDPVDLGLIKSGALITLREGEGYAPIGTQPLIFADTVIPVTSLANYGGLPQSSPTVNMAIAAGSSPVYSKSISFANMPVNAYDSIADFSTSAGGYVPLAVGPYTATFNVSQAGDGNPANNTDTARFNISDSALCVFKGYAETSKTLDPVWSRGANYLHIPASLYPPNGASFYGGSAFRIPAGSRKDTVTSVSICLAPGTTVGSQIKIEVYKLNIVTSTFQGKGYTVVKTLTASDISTAGNLVFTTLPMNIGPSNTYVVADSGIWLAVAMPVAPNALQNILITKAKIAAPINIVGYYGVADTASGAQYSFGPNNNPSSFFYTFEDVPAIVLNFGDSRNLANVEGIAGTNPFTVQGAFPNPANTSINIPVSVSKPLPVIVRLYNMTGQEVMRQDLGIMQSGQTKTAVFQTNNLPAGIYSYSLDAEGGHVADRITVLH
jgi:hypothetical protein